jgi:cell division septal protein FtsQ
MSQNDTTELEPDALAATGAEVLDDDPAQETAQEPLGTAPVAAPRSRRRRRIALAGVVGLGLLWSVGWHSPVTLVEHVVVDAPRGLSAESIRLASGISAADHVPAVDPDAVRAGIMTAIPAVADVSVRRSLPNTIELEVTGRRPFAAAGGQGLPRDGRRRDRLRQGCPGEGHARHLGSLR